MEKVILCGKSGSSLEPAIELRRCNTDPACCVISERLPECRLYRQAEMGCGYQICQHTIFIHQSPPQIAVDLLLLLYFGHRLRRTGLDQPHQVNCCGHSLTQALIIEECRLGYLRSLGERSLCFLTGLLG